MEDSLSIQIFAFFHKIVARRVVDRDNHTLNRKPLKVAIYIPDKPTPGKRSQTKKTKEENEAEEEMEEQQPTSVVKVKGLKRIKSDDTMRYYFENHRRSSGGEILDVTYQEEDEDIVFITFSKPQSE